ncbi:MAG: NAD(+)/NADH kinase [Chloroflexota bacterium]
MSNINCVGVLAHPLRPPTFPVAERIREIVQARQIETWLYTEWDAEQVKADVQRADIIVAIGGDGAMLRAARVCAPYGVPVLGVNMGQLGFLTEIAEPDDCDPQFDTLFAGDYWIEQRMMISAAVLRGGEVIATGEALNDVVVSGAVVGRMIQIDTYIDGDWTTTYHADALVVATSTGSTAYALACGGPILPPELNNILIVPAAPHLSMSRPLVLAEGARVDVLPSSSSANTMLVTADGANIAELEPGDSVRVRASDHVTRFVRMRGRNYFYRSLLDRLEPRIQRRDHQAAARKLPAADADNR